MSVIDILTRVDAICKKYDHFYVDDHHNYLHVSGADAPLQWLSTDELAGHNKLALALPDSTQTIGAPKQTGSRTTSASCTAIKFDSDGQFESEHIQQTSQLRQEYVMTKIKQALETNSHESALIIRSVGVKRIFRRFSGEWVVFGMDSDSSVTFCEGQLVILLILDHRTTLPGTEVVTFRPISTTEIQPFSSVRQSSCHKAGQRSANNSFQNRCHRL